MDLALLSSGARHLWAAVAAGAVEGPIEPFGPDPMAEAGARSGWILWAILAAMVVIWVADDLLHAWRRRRQAGRRAEEEQQTVLPPVRRALSRRQPRRLVRSRSTRPPGRAPGSSAKAETGAARKAGSR